MQVFEISAVHREPEISLRRAGKRDLAMGQLKMGVAEFDSTAALMVCNLDIPRHRNALWSGTNLYPALQLKIVGSAS